MCMNFPCRDIREMDEVIVFGAGYNGQIAVCLFDILGIQVAACMDNDINKEGKTVFGNVHSMLPCYLRNIPIVISVQDQEVEKEIHKQCMELGYKEFFFYSDIEKLIHSLSDKEYLSVKYAMRFPGEKIDWDNPQTFNEKLQWLKVYDRKSEYTKMVDKYEVKQYVAEKIGEEYIISTLGVWNTFSEIDFETLPNQFVIKCTHDSGGLVIVKDKERFDKESARLYIEERMKKNHYLGGREWPYKNVIPRIIIEKYMEDQATAELKDYKFFCFNGKPRIILTVEGGHGDESKTIRRMYDENWKRYPVGLHGKKNEISSEEKPEKLEEMLEIARRLSEGIRHIRVDLYLVDHKIYFGELTFYHMSGYEIFDPIEYDAIFGDFLNLNQ